MPFSITYSSSNNDQLLRSIAGAYFKQQRLSKDLSLIETSKALHLNKGFLSDLEHGNRHFPEGIINQLNSFYSCNFDESISLREDAEKMFNGIEIETDSGEKKMAYAETLPIELKNKSSMIQVVLYQGINRQIRKMFAKLGYEVESLKRIQHATLTIEGLKKGQVKPIKPKQVKELKTYIAKIKREYAKNSNNG